MYKLCFKRKFIAQHFLIGGDWGPENNQHSHAYELELRLFGKSLNKHNYLVDLDLVEETLDSVINKFEDKLLNDLPFFKETNPSLELFSRMLTEIIAKDFKGESLEVLEVRLWENDFAWASWEQSLK
jgi:6-pyruvoyltetrahydropterin/6-carboxytetrahydropterin synthase